MNDATTRVSLASAVGYLHREGALSGLARPRVDKIPGHRAPAWECVFVERRLDGRDPRVDVMGAVCERSGGHGWSTDLFSELLADHPVLTRWALTAAAPECAAPLLWFEWDMPDGSPREPLASVCVSNAIVGDRAARRAPTAGPARDRLHGDVAASLLTAGTRGWRDVLTAVTAPLGARGELLHIASLRPRGMDRLRLALWLDAGAVVPWLRAIGWPGPTDDLPRVLLALAPPFRGIGVQIEVGPGVGPYLAFEAPQVRDRGAARRALPTLCALAPIAPEAAADFLHWPGDGLVEAPEAPEAPVPVVRHVYIKLTRGPADAWSAKGYFGITTQAMAGPARPGA